MKKPTLILAATLALSGCATLSDSVAVNSCQKAAAEAGLLKNPSSPRFDRFGDSDGRHVRITEEYRHPEARPGEHFTAENHLICKQHPFTGGIVSVSRDRQAAERIDPNHYKPRVTCTEYGDSVTCRAH